MPGSRRGSARNQKVAPAGSLVWEVRVPDKRASLSSWGAKPRGELMVITPQHGEERIAIPKQVARTMASKQRSGELDPSSRAELLHTLGVVSATCARLRVEGLIDRREYASEEIRTKLRQDGYTQKTIDECLERACAIGLVSDARFADSFIRSKVYAGWGAARITRELARRGIEVSELAGWPYEYLDPDDEESRALEVARSRHANGPHSYERLVRHLCSRGFSTGVAMRAARRALDERPNQDLVDF